MTPPAIAPTFGPELDEPVETLLEVGAAEEAKHVVCWHELHVGGMSEHIWFSGQVGQEGVSGEHPVTHRRNNVLYEARI